MTSIRPEPVTAPLDRISHITFAAEMRCDDPDAWMAFQQTVEEQGLIHHQFAAAMRLILMSKEPETFVGLLERAPQIAQTAILASRLAECAPLQKQEFYARKANQLAKNAISIANKAEQRAKKLLLPQVWESNKIGAATRRTVLPCLTKASERLAEDRKMFEQSILSMKLAKNLTLDYVAESYAEHAYTLELVYDPQDVETIKFALEALDKGYIWLRALEKRRKGDESYNWWCWLVGLSNYFKLDFKRHPPVRHYWK